MVKQVTRKFDIPDRFAMLVDTAINRIAPLIERSKRGAHLSLVVMAILALKVDDETLQAVVQKLKDAENP